MSFNLNKELTLLVLQHFHEEKFKEAARTLGCESGLYFDLKYFEEIVLEGNWDEAENYLSGFTKVMDNNHSIKIYFEMRKQKYFEALDNNDHHKALDILLKDLKVFAQVNDQLVRELSHLLIVDNIRQIKPTYQDANFGRKNLILGIKEIMRQHPVLRGKLRLPLIESHRLNNLINKSLKWQKHQNPAQEPNLLMDHVSSSSTPSISALTNSGTAMEWSFSTIGRPIMKSYERERNEILGHVRPYSIEESHNKSKNLVDISTPSQCQFMQLPSHPEVKKIVRLIYTNAGNSILALASNGVHLTWLWPCTSLNIDGKASALVPSQLWQPKPDSQLMINDLTSVIGGNPVSCLALAKRDGYIISTSGGKISLFNMLTFKTLRTMMAPPPMVTCLAFYPEDNNVFGIGLDDSTIIIYHVRDDEVLVKLEGHSTRVTALAFSNTSNILISGDANAQIILWNTERWEKLKERHLHIQGNFQVQVSETQIQFQPADETNFLVVHKSLLAIYDATVLTCVNQWLPEVPVLISQATFSSDGRTVYSIFGDGTVTIFNASNFQLCSRIHPSSYLTPIASLRNYPICIAAHPQKSNQFAVGLTDGSVYVFEPRSPVGDWIKRNLRDSSLDALS